MSSLHQEHHFETEICEYLAAHGWYYEVKDSTYYDRELALYVPDLIDWVKSTQNTSWEKLFKTHGEQTAKILSERLRKNLDDRGTLAVLRKGIDMLGLKERLSLAQFKPALDLNKTIQEHYAANRLRVVRQVHHSLNNPQDAIDLVLFLNGIPVATLELKSDFTQSVEDAVNQYRFDRHPHPIGKRREPLLAFPGAALVHFAVSQSEVMMSTRLSGPETVFLPFNKGNGYAKGNPPNPSGFATDYLWEGILEKHSWLEILGRYLIAEKNDKKQLTHFIFPRYHQLDVTRKILTDIVEKGAGQRYLIQHSAGSGKTKSIAWSACFLADLHDANNNKVFDSVFVISDRTVIDRQLREDLFSLGLNEGVIDHITLEEKGKYASKSEQLAEALKNNKKIIVCTIQTFPALYKKISELSQMGGRHFAIIADEAHSSQTGEASSKLRQILSAEEWHELEDGGEISTEDLLAAQMASRASGDGLTFIAFTATPKTKTLELFGRKDADGKPQPFHLYSMRQAIEEGFILDVLQNYTPYKLAVQLARNGEAWDEKEVKRSQALKSIMQWVRLHPYNISQKVQVVIEHFLQNVQPLLKGTAKAMVVVGSRKEAVRWHKAMTAYIKDRAYPLGVLVAFSGEVDDKESFLEPVTENNPLLNPGLKGMDIKSAFKKEQYHILLVANKFQTGFDEPLLCGMYIDKKLGGIQAVQTLSRLNRAYPGKSTTYILDFVNKAEEILNAFKLYYETAELEATTDPHIIYDLRAKLDAMGYYDDFEVDKVVRIETSPTATQKELSAAIAPVADRLLKQFNAAKKQSIAAEMTQQGEAFNAAEDIMRALNLFKHDMSAFIRLYSFLSQIFNYGNTDIEKRFIFYKLLLPLLGFGLEREVVDLSKLALTHYALRNMGKKSLVLTSGDVPKLKPIDGAGSGIIHEEEKMLLTEIIKKINSLFEGELSDGDQLSYINSIKNKLMENETLSQQSTANSKKQFSNSPDLLPAIVDAIMDNQASHATMSTQALNSEQIQHGIKDVLLDHLNLYEALRAKSQSRKIVKDDSEIR